MNLNTKIFKALIPFFCLQFLGCSVIGGGVGVAIGANTGKEYLKTFKKNEINFRINGE